MVDELARSGAMDMIAVDSVAALVPRAELEGDIGDHQVSGARAGPGGQGGAWVSSKLSGGRTNT